MVVATFVGNKNGKMEMKFSTKEDVTHDIAILHSGKMTLFPMCKGKWCMCIHIWRVLPEIKLKWVIAVVMSTTEENPETIIIE